MYGKYKLHKCLTFVSTELQQSKLAKHVEERVGEFLTRTTSTTEGIIGEVVIRVLSSFEKCVEVKPLFRARYVDILTQFNNCS